MVNSKGILYPRIVEEVVDYHELMKVWNCSYITAHRVLHGITAPNHIRKKKLSDYLGIPVDELWVRVDSALIPERYVYEESSDTDIYVELTEEEKQEHQKQYQHEYYLTTTKPKRAELRRQKALLSQDSVTSEDSENPEAPETTTSVGEILEG